MQEPRTWLNRSETDPSQIQWTPMLSHLFSFGQILCPFVLDRGMLGIVIRIPCIGFFIHIFNRRQNTMINQWRVPFPAYWFHVLLERFPTIVLSPLPFHCFAFYYSFNSAFCLYSFPSFQGEENLPVPVAFSNSCLYFNKDIFKEICILSDGKDSGTILA
jgi:hypothetical protein